MAMIFIFLIVMSYTAGTWADCSTSIRTDGAKNFDINFIYNSWFEQFRSNEPNMDHSRCNWADFRWQRSSPNNLVLFEHYNKKSNREKRVTRKGHLFDQCSCQKNKFKLQWDSKNGVDLNLPIEDFVVLKHSEPGEEKYLITVIYENLGQTDCKEHIWIFTNNRNIDQNLVEKIQNEAANLGIDTNNLIRSNHLNCGNKY